MINNTQYIKYIRDDFRVGITLIHRKSYFYEIKETNQRRVVIYEFLREPVELYRGLRILL